MTARWTILSLALCSYLLTACSSDSTSCPAGMPACNTNCGTNGIMCSGPLDMAMPGDSGGPIDMAMQSGPTLASLSVSTGTLSPSFSPLVTMYTVTVSPLVPSLTVTATTAVPGGTILINGATATAGTATVSLTGGVTMIMVTVQDQGGASKSYSVAVMNASSVYMKASNTDSGDGFSAVSLSGDTLAVGAPGESSKASGIGGDQTDNSLLRSGAVYVFVRSGNSWSQQAYIKASNPDTLDFFGSGVSLSGDTLAVGAYGEDSSATGIGGDQTNNAASSSGAVYVFVRSGSTWTQQAYIKASNAEANDGFGNVVSLSGDTLAVEALGEDSNATGINGDQTNNAASSSGAVYVFVRSGSTWTQQAYVKASNAEASDLFGYGLSLSGDTLAVGAYGEASNATGIGGSQTDNSKASSGAVYVFTRSGVTWSQQAYIKASNTDSGDQFGYSVALSGDTLAVGAYLEDSNATGIGGTQTNNLAPSSGAVYVFTRSGVMWSQQAYIKASNAEASDQFGYTLSLSGDTLAVGANAESSNATGIGGNQSDNSAFSAGAAYVFTRNGATWSQQAYVKASNTDSSDQFGYSLSVSGPTLAVGSPGESSNATGIGGNQLNNSKSSSGAVYIFQ